LASINILVTTLGASWPVIPELLGFLDPENFSLFQYHSGLNIFRQKLDKYITGPLDEIWVVTTHDEKVLKGIEVARYWIEVAARKKPIPLHCFFYNGISDLSNEDECRCISDLILRVTLKAKELSRGKTLILSLTGGRKTMSADMQRAADIWGCDLLLHIANKEPINEVFKNPPIEKLLYPLEQKIAENIFPVIIQSVRFPSLYSQIPSPLTSSAFPVRPDMANDRSVALLSEIENRIGQAQNVYFNAYQQRIGNETLSFFQAFHQLPPTVIEKLKNTYIGKDPGSEKKEQGWLIKLPKAELHCHLGGVLSTEHLIEVALTEKSLIEKYTAKIPAFSEWLSNINKYVVENNLGMLKKIAADRKIRNLFDLPEPIPVAAFISTFEKNISLLEKVIYGKFIDGNCFFGIGIREYEKLGDLQGSAILQSDRTLLKTCEYLRFYAKSNNIRYMELRCSPCNYERGNMTAEKVVEILYNELYDSPDTTFRLIIIGSRHGDETTLRRHIELALKLLHTPKYQNFIVGFDLAGDEAKASPAEVRELFLPLMKQCMRITIHAGETQPADNIWEAVYVLNADRIGHGLSLKNSPNLIKRFIDRKIYVEMCPSSNHQIVGYQFFPDKNEKNIYPLSEYLNASLKVTINTDNPGISRTTLSKEFVRAAQLTPGGITMWDLLKIIRHGFLGAFLAPAEKRKLIFKAEEEIFSKLPSIM